MKTFVAAVVVLMACSVSAQFPPGWNYDPFKYYPYTALQPPVQETAEVVAARAAHMAAHAAVKPSRVVAFHQSLPQVVLAQPIAGIQDTPDVWAAKLEHYRAHQAAAARNGVISSLPPLVQPQQQLVWGAPQPVQDTPEVHAAKMEFYRAFNEAAARSG